MTKIFTHHAFLKKIIIVSWACLGTYRGNEAFTAGKSHRYPKTPDLYLDRCVWGLGGALIYQFPVFLPFTVYYELSNLEKFLRNIKDD